MIDTGTQRLDYFNTKALSNSLMSIYEDDFYQFVSYWVYNQPLKQIKSESLILGSIVDIELNPNENVQDKFKIYQGVAPTGLNLKFIQILLEIGNENFELAYEMLKSQHDRNLRDTLEKFKSKFESYKDYYETLKNKEKPIISIAEYNKAMELAKSARSHPHTKIFVNAQSERSIEVIYQLEIFITVDGVPLKGAVDKIIIDHYKKRIIAIDYKTSSNALEFEQSAQKYNYWRQGAFYLFLIKNWMKEKGFEDYELKPFIFLVISTTKTNHNFLYRLSEKDVRIAEFGGRFYDGEFKKGWRTIISEISELQTIGDWTYPYEVISSKGFMELDIFNDDTQ